MFYRICVGRVTDLASRLASCYAATMLKERTRWRGDPSTRALKRLDEIEASIRALEDNDLLDFADIFVGQPGSPLGDIAAVEMARRQIAL